MSQQFVDDGVCLEQRPRGKQVPQCDSECVNIRASVGVLCVFCLLRRHVIHGAHDLIAAGQLILIDPR